MSTRKYKMPVTIKAAYINVIGGVVIAIISGFFLLISKCQENKNQAVTQTAEPKSSEVTTEAFSNEAIWQKSEFGAVPLQSNNGSKDEVVFLENPIGLDRVVNDAHSAFLNEDYTSAVELSVSAQAIIGDCVNSITNSKAFQLSEQFERNIAKLYPILIEKSLSQGEYDKVRAYVNILSNLYVDFNPYISAIEKITDLLDEGRSICYFSNDEIKRLRAIDKNKLGAYLFILSAWGYLQPFELDQAAKTTRWIDYAKVFNLDFRLPYVDSVRVCLSYDNAVKKDGTPLSEANRNALSEKSASDEYLFQWRGFDKYVPVNITKDAYLAMGLCEDQCRSPLITIDKVEIIDNDIPVEQRKLSRVAALSSQGFKWENKIAGSGKKRKFAVIADKYQVEVNGVYEPVVTLPEPKLVYLFVCIAFVLLGQGIWTIWKSKRSRGVDA